MFITLVFTRNLEDFILLDRDFLSVLEDSKFGDDSEIEDTFGFEQDTDAEYKTAPEDTEIIEVPHQSNIPLIDLHNSSVVDDLYCSQS